MSDALSSGAPRSDGLRGCQPVAEQKAATDSVVCPCCPLHCDDLTGAELSDHPDRCALAYQRMQWTLKGVAHAVGRADESTLMAQAVEVIRANPRIAVTGHVLDLATSRAIVRFSERLGADICVSGPNRSSQAVMKRDGSYACTLGELTRQNNSILIVGDVEVAWPRISKHLTEAKELAQLEDGPDLLEQLSALRLWATSGAHASLPVQLDQPTLRQALELVQRASYLVILVAPLQEEPLRSPLIWSTLIGLVQKMNQQRRAVILTLDETYTLRSTMASRLEVVSTRVQSIDPTLQIHLSPFGEPCQQETKATIHIGIQPSDALQSLCLPAATPGVDVAGIVYRGDGSVALPLMDWKSKTSLPSPAKRLEQLLELLE